ncbi:ComEC/Rec2 family competence protein [Candidatus Gottesmanbacteria bacterium]|nr:ComEC/Rec2 family competence protein [Candidatus Gottesmanbacteria bacterium]
MSVSDLSLLIGQMLPEPHAGLLSGILFGTKATIAPALKDALITTGTIHVTALSGANITILVSLVGTLLLTFLSRQITAVLTCGIIIGFVLFVGPSASVVRAAIMAVLTLSSTVFGRQYSALFSLGIAVVVMLLIYPSWLSDLSFQLSVLSTLGVVLFCKKRLLDYESWKKQQTERPTLLKKGATILYRLVEDDLRMTLSAQVFTIPLIFFTFGRLSLVAPLANVLIGFLVPPLTAFGLFAVVLGLVWLPLGQILGWGLWVMLSYILFVVEFCARLPFASISW